MSTGGGAGTALEIGGILAAGAATGGIGAGLLGAGALATAAGAAGGAAAATTAFSSYQTSKYQQGIAKNNQQQALNNEQNAQIAGNSAQQQQEEKNTQQMGAIRAAFAANGIDVNSGSPGNVENSATSLGETDLQNVHKNYQNQALGFGYQATDSNNQANIYGDQSENTAISAPVSILSGASSVSSGWMKAFGNTNSNGLKTNTSSDVDED